MKTTLQIGRGNVPSVFHGTNVLRVDIELKDDPVELAKVDNESVGGVFSCHSLHTLWPEQVPVALRNYWRVLEPEGTLMIVVPNFRLGCEWVVQGNEQGRELIYGRNHDARTGFTVERLNRELSNAGFALCRVTEDMTMDIVGVARR